LEEPASLEMKRPAEIEHAYFKTCQWQHFDSPPLDQWHLLWFPFEIGSPKIQTRSASK